MTAPDSLQHLVDALATRLGRGVVVNNSSMRLLVYSPPVGPVDEARVASILNRQPPREALSWVMAHGIADATGPVRVAPNPEIGLASRIGIPIRTRGVLLGYLWLIDVDISLTAEELDLATAAVGAMGAELYRERLLHELERGRERELLRDLLSETDTVRAHAAEQLVEGNLMVPASHAAAIVVQPVNHDGSPPDEGVRVSMNLAMNRLRHRLSPRHSLHFIRPDHGVLAAAVEDPAVRAHPLSDHARDLYDILKQDILVGNDIQIFIGIGGPRPLPDFVCSYREARDAVRIAQVEPRFRWIVAWDALGIYRLLSRLPIDDLDSHALHPGVLALVGCAEAAILIPTLEHYLDRACDVQATARDLSLHRASLYYRLRKIEELARINLHNGEDRLAMHLGIKVARLINLYPNGHESGTPPPIS